MGLFSHRKKEIKYSENGLYINVLSTSEGSTFYDSNIDKKIVASSKELYDYGVKTIKTRYGINIFEVSLQELCEKAFELYDDTGEDSIQINNMYDVQWQIYKIGRQYWTEDQHLTYFINSVRRGEFSVRPNDLSDDEIKNFYVNFFNNENPYNYKENLSSIVKKNKIVIDEYLQTLSDQFYNKYTKNWKDFDITRQFLQIRTFMMFSEDFHIPDYVWQLKYVRNPFIGLTNICFNYVNNKKIFTIVKKLFVEITKWEKGEIYNDGEKQKKYERPFSINWNDIGDKFYKMKTWLKKIDGGIYWLKSDVLEYIKSRAEYYKGSGKLEIDEKLLNAINEL